jgi:hypothetical protein
VANAQRSNIGVGAPPNFMLPPLQAGWTGHLASISLIAKDRGSLRAATWGHLARHSWSPPCRGITGDQGCSQAWSSGPSELVFYLFLVHG